MDKAKETELWLNVHNRLSNMLCDLSAYVNTHEYNALKKVADDISVHYLTEFKK